VLPDSTVSDAVALPGRPGEFAVVSGDSIAILRARAGEVLGGFPAEFAKHHDPSAKRLSLAVSSDGSRLAVGHDGKNAVVASNNGALYGVSLENENSEPFFRCAELEGISEGFRIIRQLIFPPTAEGLRR